VPKVSFRKAGVDGFNIFYREAGSKGAPMLVLLHGFPTASLADRSFTSRCALEIDRLYQRWRWTFGFGL
jgi:pimeloyl-ACP methyl ester carboxylesterase